MFAPKSMTKAKDPFYNLWMFPYPSAEGVHVGTIFSSTGSDVYGRFMRMQGKDVFQPIGFDSFGIHSENYAIKIESTPQAMLARALEHYKEQFKDIGHGYDWTRTVTTSDIDYYKWTQWLFVVLFKAGLAYKKQASVNWCPSCKTVLADEQIVTPAQAGKMPQGYDSIKDLPEGIRICERCGSIPEKRDLSQWFFRITDYANRLLDNLDKIDWSERVVKAQLEWIGRKEGINIAYTIKGKSVGITCFTTRPDTNFGATFIVVSPEYARDNLVDKVSSKSKQKVSEYINKSLAKTEQQRKEEAKTKTGVFTGLYAVNPLNNYLMPIWISDFVLADFGTGAVVGVPGHDKRDFEFASAFGITIKRVVVGSDGDKGEIVSIDQVEEKEGVMINSDFLDGLSTREASVKIMDHIEEKGWGQRHTTYHLRDWLISRQRYWGPPIPMIYCDACAQAGRSWFTSNDREKSTNSSVQSLLHSEQTDWEHAGWYPDDNLPVKLPVINDYKPKGMGSGPLADHPEFYETTCPQCGAPARRETDVSDTFLDSSWYFLRYTSIDADSASNEPFDGGITKRWLPVDLYFGGAEHAVLHLMYARFVTQVLYDLKLIDFEEPFPRFFAHGLMIKDGAKMSKSRGNVVNPDEYIDKYGADALRLYLMFMGPMDSSPDFRDTGIDGARRFVERVWNLFVDSGISSLLPRDSDQNRRFSRKAADDQNQHDEAKLSIKIHQTIKKVTKDMQGFAYNTAIAAIMELVNEMKKKPAAITRESLVVLCKLMAPFTPHMCEELWTEFLGEEFSIHRASWPQFDPELVVDETITIVLQVNGKLRSTMAVSLELAQDKAALVEHARKDEKIRKYIQGKETKEIVIPQKIINFVVD